MPWQLFERGNSYFYSIAEFVAWYSMTSCHFALAILRHRRSRKKWWRSWRHELSTPIMMTLPSSVTCVHVRHVIFDDEADITTFQHLWRWAFHLEDKRRCECYLSPARRNELELKDSSFLPLESCNKGTEIYILTQARELNKQGTSKEYISSYFRHVQINFKLKETWK